MTDADREPHASPTISARFDNFFFIAVVLAPNEPSPDGFIETAPGPRARAKTARFTPHGKKPDGCYDFFILYNKTLYFLLDVGYF